MTTNRIEFEVEKDAKKFKLAAARPNVAQRQAGDVVYAAKVMELANKGVMLAAKMKDVYREQKLWDDAKEAELAEIDTRIEANEAILPGEDGRSRKKGVKLSELRAAAVQLRRDRMARLSLLGPLNSLQGMTAEGMAEQDRFNALVALCTEHADTGKPYFVSTQDYLDRGADADAREAANKFSEIYYRVDPNFEKVLPENKFLLKMKMCNEDGHLIGKNGEKVDVDGNPIVETVSDAAPAELFEVEDDWTAKPVAVPAEEVSLPAD